MIIELNEKIINDIFQNRNCKIYSSDDIQSILCDKYKGAENFKKILSYVRMETSKNGGSEKEGIVCSVLGYKWLRKEYHGFDCKNGKLGEIKTKTLSKNEKLSGSGHYSDFSKARFDKLIENDCIYIPAGFDNDGKVLYILEVPFNKVFLDRIWKKYEKTMKNKTRGFVLSYKDYEDIEGVKLKYYDDDVLDYVTKGFGKFIKKFENFKIKRKVKNGENFMTKVTNIWDIKDGNRYKPSWIKAVMLLTYEGWKPLVFGSSQIATIINAGKTYWKKQEEYQENILKKEFKSGTDPLFIKFVAAFRKKSFANWPIATATHDENNESVEVGTFSWGISQLKSEGRGDLVVKYTENFNK